MKDKRQFKLNMPTDLLDAVRGIAQRESRSVGAQVNVMLRNQIEAEEAAGVEFGDQSPAAGINKAALERGPSINHDERTVEDEYANG